MSGFVYETLLDEFTGGGIVADVNVLAAQRIAIDFLKDAWKALERFKNESEAVETERTQVGM